ncbi:carbohydrate ABC transporter permease [Horticoccus luteus]|uniref:Carbohydrate ABC transporter permease n=1 Tax=Horticoccus luteus TaxID=2862869 RepID=A0A8F9TVT2_9BACT|nr:carbohydrate ABC transporter permease [Horticoccus luteus]QYM79213.1 carbohydrate ABC transporter permease [Horticoccus luteus]
MKAPSSNVQAPGFARNRALGRAAVKWLVSVAVALVFLAPLLWMVRASFTEEPRIFLPGFGGWFDGWTVGNYADAWRRAGLGRGLANSALQVAIIAGAGLIVNAMAAYAFARFVFRGRDVLFAGVVILIVLPIEVLAVPLFFTARDLGLTGGFGAAMAGLSVPFVAKAFNIYFLRQHFLSLPMELEEAAAIDGAGVWRQFWTLALPAVKPALATVVLLDVLTHWGDFLWPLMISTRAETRTVQLSLANLFTQPPLQWGDILACAVLATLPVMLLFRFFQRHIVATEARAGIK